MIGKRIGIGLACCLVWCGAGACDVAVPARGATAWKITSSPVDGAVGVARADRLVVRFDRLIVPQTIDAYSASLHSGNVRIDPVLRWQPVQRELWLDLDAQHPLDAGVAYVLQVDGLVDLDGADQPEPYRVHFTTGDAVGGPPAQPQLEVSAVRSLLEQRCGQSSCHDGNAPAVGLDLVTAQGILTTAIGARSHSPAGTTGEEGVRGASWLTGLRIIDVVEGQGQPATSELLYKVLGDPHVGGDPMPPEGPPLSETQLAQISAWIAAGAPLQ